MNARLLLVDDDPSVLVTYKLIFEQQGYVVFGAATERDAFSLLERGSFDLLICDLSLERAQGGLEIIEFARQRYAGVKAVLLTGFATPELTKEAEDNGIQVIFKPIEIRELLDRIAALVGYVRAQRAAG